ncbi:Putative ribonuclease H protein At1g65750 [Linum perenne]
MYAQASGRNKRVVFAQLKDRLWQRLQSWRDKKFRKAGKEVLIKDVAQSLPVYYMNVFLLTKTIVMEIERMIKSFWWEAKGRGGGGIAWMRWDWLCVRKELGNMLEFNQAMLRKQGWKLFCSKLFSDPNTLSSRVYKA